MTVIGYIRVSTEQQDLDKQRHLLLEYAHQQQLQINEFIEIEISSRKSQRERRIIELLDRLQSGDLLLVAELSRLGRNMLEMQLKEDGWLLAGNTSLTIQKRVNGARVRVWQLTTQSLGCDDCDD